MIENIIINIVLSKLDLKQIESQKSLTMPPNMTNHYYKQRGVEFGGDGDGGDGGGDGDSTSWRMRSDYGGGYEFCGFF